MEAESGGQGPTPRGPRPGPSTAACANGFPHSQRQICDHNPNRIFPTHYSFIKTADGKKRPNYRTSRCSVCTEHFENRYIHVSRRAIAELKKSKRPSGRSFLTGVYSDGSRLLQDPGGGSGWDAPKRGRGSPPPRRWGGSRGPSFFPAPKRGQKLSPGGGSGSIHPPPGGGGGHRPLMNPGWKPASGK